MGDGAWAFQVREDTGLARAYDPCVLVASALIPARDTSAASISDPSELKLTGQIVHRGAAFPNLSLGVIVIP
jgi:hypothetical protein